MQRTYCFIPLSACGLHLFDRFSNQPLLAILQKWTKTPGLLRRGVLADALSVVQKVAFPVLLAAGTLLGKYDKFKDAPEPVLETQAGSPHSTRAV
jgi:hypothetical protein